MADDRVPFVPMDLVSILPFRLNTLSEEDYEKVSTLIAEAFTRGYNDGYVRGLTEESGRQYLKDQRIKKALSLPNKEPAGKHPAELNGGASA